MTLESVKFPVYKIRKHRKIINEDNIIIVDTDRDEYILDNKNLPGNFLQRRLKLKLRNKIYPLYNPILTHRDLLLVKNQKKFIDNEGILFEYKRERFYPIKVYWIESKEFFSNKLLIKPKNIFCKFEFLLNSFNVESKYIRLINYDNGYIFYDLQINEPKNSRIKI